MDFIIQIITALLGVIVGAIVWVEDLLHAALANTGVSPQVQSAIMIAAAVLLIVAAFRIFGGIIGILLTAFLLLFVLHILAPGLLETHPA